MGPRLQLKIVGSGSVYALNADSRQEPRKGRLQNAGCRGLWFFLHKNKFVPFPYRYFPGGVWGGGGGVNVKYRSWFFCVFYVAIIKSPTALTSGKASGAKLFLNDFLLLFLFTLFFVTLATVYLICFLFKPGSTDVDSLLRIFLGSASCFSKDGFFIVHSKSIICLVRSKMK